MSKHHGPSLLAYFLVFAALIALTGLTVWVADVDLGKWHLPVALLIASVKGLLVCLIFMHLLYSKRLMALVFSAAFVWVFILLALVFSDYMTRGWM